jgi:FixJ family two-component response regulator
MMMTWHVRYTEHVKADWLAFRDLRDAARVPPNQPADEARCLIPDARLPGVSGLDFQHEWADAGIWILTIFITCQRDIPITVRT